MEKSQSAKADLCQLHPISWSEETQRNDMCNKDGVMPWRGGGGEMP